MTVVKPSQDVLDAYSTLAKAEFENNLSATRQAVAESPEFAARVFAGSHGGEVATGDFRALNAGPITASAAWSLVSVVIWSKISTNTPLVFNQDDREIGKLNFAGEAWGVGVGGGIVWGSGWFVHPSQLVGEVDYTVSTSVAITSISFFKNGVPLGVQVAGGLNAQVGIVSGKGEFTRA